MPKRPGETDEDYEERIDDACEDLASDLTSRRRDPTGVGLAPPAEGPARTVSKEEARNTLEDQYRRDQENEDDPPPEGSQGTRRDPRTPRPSSGRDRTPFRFELPALPDIKPYLSNLGRIGSTISRSGGVSRPLLRSPIIRKAF